MLLDFRWITNIHNNSKVRIYFGWLCGKMTIKKQTGIILSLGMESKNESEQLLKALSNSIDAVYLKNTIMIRESAQIIKALRNIMKENGSDKPIIVDYRLDQEDVDDLKEISGLLESEGADAMTVMAVYDENFIKLCKERSRIQVFTVIDVGLDSFKKRFSDSFVVKNASSAMKNECGGVIMTSLHLDRIQKVRDAMANFPILTVLEKGSRIGATIPFGSDFEVIPRQLLEK
jgi:orotidine-5'-phosphate decarboxylase